MGTTKYVNSQKIAQMSMLVILPLIYVWICALLLRELLQIMFQNFVCNFAPSMIVLSTMRIQQIDGVGTLVINPRIFTVIIKLKHVKKNALIFNHLLMLNTRTDSASPYVPTQLTFTTGITIPKNV